MLRADRTRSRSWPCRSSSKASGGDSSASRTASSERDWSAARDRRSARRCRPRRRRAQPESAAERALRPPRCDPRGRQPRRSTAGRGARLARRRRRRARSDSAVPPAQAARTCLRTASVPTASSIASQGFEWVADGIAPELENEVDAGHVLPRRSGSPVSRRSALRNEIFTGKVARLPGVRARASSSRRASARCHRPDQRRRQVVGLHRLRRLRRRARVERRRDGRAPHRSEPRRRGDRPRARRSGAARARAEAPRGLRHGARRDLHHRRRPPLRRRQPRRLRADRRLQARPDRPPRSTSSCLLRGSSRSSRSWARVHRGRPRARGVADDAAGRHRGHLRGIRPPELRSRSPHRVHARHHRPEAPRVGAPERPEAREPRPPRRRRRTRLQQPPDRDHGLCVAAARARRTATRSSHATWARSSVRPTGPRS